MNILAIDLGSIVGWAALVDDRVLSGVQQFRPRRFDGGGMQFLRFRQWLSEIHEAVGQVSVIFYEEVRFHAGVDSSQVYGAFWGTLVAWCEHHGIPYEGIPVATIKKHVTGKGNAPKEAVIEAVRALGHDPVDHNEADALALLHWALANRVAGGVR